MYIYSNKNQKYLILRYLFRARRYGGMKYLPLIEPSSKMLVSNQIHFIIHSSIPIHMDYIEILVIKFITANFR